jgi:hypothetical protein
MGRRKNGYLVYIVIFVIAILLYLRWTRSKEGFDDTPKQKPKGVIIEMIGGLGNQLYIYSAGKVMQKTLEVPIYITIDPGTTFTHTKIDYRPILFKDYQAIERSDERMSDKIDGRLQNKFWDPWSPISLPSTDKYVYLSQQWYQDFPSIQSVIPEVRKSVVSVLEGLYPEVDIEPSSAFIHVRRGDYTNDENKIHLLDMTYYNKAIESLNANTEISRYYMFSDDIAWCKQQEWNTKRPIEYVNEPNEMKSLYMMSKCKGGAAISNSTFSTWGAILGPYESGGTIVYPSKWLYGASTNFPTEWVRI